MRVLSFGGGLNSTALCIAAWRRGMQIDAILFADTRAKGWRFEIDHERIRNVFSMTATGAPGLRTPSRAGTPSPFHGWDGRLDEMDLSEQYKHPQFDWHDGGEIVVSVEKREQVVS